jgi:hypothetical protein
VSYIAGSVPPRARPDNGIQPPVGQGLRLLLSSASEVVKKFREWTSIDREPFGLVWRGSDEAVAKPPIHVRTGYQVRPAPQWHK